MEDRIIKIFLWQETACYAELRKTHAAGFLKDKDVIVMHVPGFIIRIVIFFPKNMYP